MKTIRSTAPTTSILNPAFRYRPAASTDVAATFARIRREQQAAERAAAAAAAADNVKPIRRKVAK